jgi:predicted dehydrogenase
LRQIVQNPRSGEIALLEVPAPCLDAGQVLVRNRFSLLSPGTEAHALDFGRMSLLSKARSRPDLVAQVTRKLREEGPLPTLRAVMGRLDAFQPLGYSSAGVVEAVGRGVSRFAPGDRVACAGAGWANHAEFVAVPENLVARVPEGVALEHAAFATLGAIALQGLRVAEPTLGEIAAVVGLGLIGQLAVQLLHANGCRVVALDLDPDRVKLALEQGAEWAYASAELPPAWREEASGGHGADLVLVAASATDAAPLRLAAELCRRRGRISLVGNVPIELDRRTFYEKELELRMSTSYGPGRYDRSYEESGLDYPVAYVRWTENRNLQAFLQLVASGGVCPERLGPEIVPFADAVRVYQELGRGPRRPLALLFEYAHDASPAREVPVAPPRAAARDGSLGVSLVGAGNYAKGVLLPALAAVANVRRVCLVTATGTSARRSAERFGYARCGTDPELALADPDVALVFVATRHDSHADLAIRALRAGKAVWLEKPVALGPDELDRLGEALAGTGGFLAVGYNRRFSPHARAVRRHFEGRLGPLSIHYVVAPGPTPRGTWITDPAVGGGRVIGEVCHFVDLCQWWVGAPVRTVYARRPSRDPELDDSIVATLGFADGSTALIEYLARASRRLPKERFEVSADDRTAQCDQFRVTRILGGADVKTRRQDKGQAAAVAEVVDAVRRGLPSPFAWAEVAATSRATFAMLESAASGRVVEIGA